MSEDDQSDSSFVEALRGALAAWSIPASAEQLERLSAHYRLMIDANQTTNLTRIVDPIEAAVKHYADSLALSLWARQHDVNAPAVLDVGSGAGFPAVPLAVMNPGWRVTALDGTRKKIEFIRQAAEVIGIHNLDVVHAHTAHWKTTRLFDVVCVRAVSSIERCVPMAARLLAPTGRFVAYKTIDAAEHELAEARAVMTVNHFSQAPPFDYTLRLGDEELHRRLVVLGRRGE